jgi:hypothetical protein
MSRASFISTVWGHWDEEFDPGVGRETHATAGQEAGATNPLARLVRIRVSGWLTQGREAVRDAEQEDEPDDATISCAGPGDGVIKPRMMA